MRPTPILVLAPLAFSAGCCTFAEVFGCVPERPVVRVSFRTPEDCLRTFLWATASGDTRLLYESLGEDFKSRRGLDGLSFEVAWRRLKEQMPAVQALGRAKVAGRRRRTDGSWAFDLERFGRHLTVVVGRYAFWEAARSLPADEGRPEASELAVSGGWLKDLGGVLTGADAEAGRLAVVLENDDLIGIDRSNLAWIRVGWTWRIRDLAARGTGASAAGGSRALGGKDRTR